MNSRSQWAALPADLLICLLELLNLESRVAAVSTCKSWRAVAEHPALWTSVHFATHRDGSRRTELRRLLSLAAWAARHAGGTRQLAISARLPADAQPAGLKAVAQAALAAAASLQELSVTANRGFWAGEWLPRLRALRALRLCSKEGGLSLHGDLAPLCQLTSLVLEARHAVTLSESVRLPPSVHSVELSCIRDTLPPQLSQLSGLRRLCVRRGTISDGVLLIEYDCLAQLSALTWLALERQEEAWLPPPELLLLTRLRHLSIAGNDCSRWPLHGSDEAFSSMLARMPSLTSLDLSCCGLEELPPALLHTGAAAGADSDTDGDSLGYSGGWLDGDSQLGEQDMGASSGGSGGLPAAPTAGAALEGVGGVVGPALAAAAARGPRLLRLLAHGNQLEASAINGDPPELLWFPASVRQLSLDWHVLMQLPVTRLPPRCRTLALLGSDGAMKGMLSALPRLPVLLPSLRLVLLEAAALDALAEQPRGPAGSPWQLVGGRWRPTRLPGQRKAGVPAEGVLDQLREANVRVVELAHPEQLSATLDGLERGGAGQGQPAVAGAAAL